MWVHYAHNHTGFVIGFDSSAAFFREDGRILRQVQYEPRPNINVPPELDESVCFFKSPEWETEHEWRCVKKFDKDESRLVSFEQELIREIIIGHKAEDSLISQLVAAVEGWEMTRVNYYLSPPSRDHWNLGHRPNQ